MHGKMNVLSSSTSPLSAPAVSVAAGHDAPTPSMLFAPPPLPAFLSTPYRPGFQIPELRHPSTGSCTHPAPRPKFRRFAWSKIPASRVLGRSNVWTTGDRLFREFKLDFDRIEELFSVTANTSTPPNAPLSPSASTGVKYPPSVSAAGPQESSNRASSTLQPRTQSAEVSIQHVIVGCFTCDWLYCRKQGLPPLYA